MKKSNGLALVELIMFIILMSIIALTILVPFNSAFRGIPSSHQANIMATTAEQCMEWYIGQRYSKGFSNITCPSTTTPAFCTAPDGYSIAVDVVCADGNTTNVVVSSSNSSQTVQLFMSFKSY